MITVLMIMVKNRWNNTEWEKKFREFFFKTNEKFFLFALNVFNLPERAAEKSEKERFFYSSSK